jgi:hypothetical protein
MHNISLQHIFTFCFLHVSMYSAPSSRENSRAPYWKSPAATQILSEIKPLNAELNPICHLLILLGDLTFMGTCNVSVTNKMQRHTVYLYLETALNVSGGTATHHQERIQLYLQHLVFVTPLLRISWRRQRFISCSNCSDLIWGPTIHFSQWVPQHFDWR